MNQTNYATWNFSLWLYNDESAYSRMRDMVEELAVNNEELTQEHAYNILISCIGKVTPDKAKIGYVDLSEIVDDLQEDYNDFMEELNNG